MKSALIQLYDDPEFDDVPKRTMKALFDRKLTDSKNKITEAGETIVIASMPLAKQCDTLSIKLNKISWIKSSKPEYFALSYFEEKNYIGAACEGGAIGTAIKALCLDALTKSSIFYGTCIDAREDACLKGVVVLSGLENDNLQLVLQEIEHTSKSKYLNAFSEIISYSFIQEWYPGLTLEFANALYDALPKSTFVKIAKWISLDFSHRNGWPDLTLIKDNRLSFVEVKTTDKLHESQLNTIPALTKEIGLPVSIIKLEKQNQQKLITR